MPMMQEAPPPITKLITLAEGMTVKDLADKLDAVIVEANLLLRALRSKAKRPPGVDMTGYLSAHTAVTRAEYGLAMASYDLRTASGEDGFG